MYFFKIALKQCNWKDKTFFFVKTLLSFQVKLGKSGYMQKKYLVMVLIKTTSKHNSLKILISKQKP